MTARLRRIARRATRPVVRWFVGARFRNLPGVDVLRVGDDLHVYLDDAPGPVAFDAARRYARGVTADLEYIGGGMVRAWWPAVIWGQHVALTDTDALAEWSDRLNDIRGITPAELAEYAYDDTGVENCER